MRAVEPGSTRNSGRLRGWLQAAAEHHGVSWDVQLVNSPDRCLVDFDGVVATSDSGILDRAVRWVDLAEAVWWVDLT